MSSFFKDIFTVACHVCRCALRLKIIQALTAAVTGFIILLFFNIDTDGNRLYFIKGFLAYSNYIVMLFSGLGTMCIACYLFRMEIEHKHYYFSFTKAVSRPRIFIGYWLGTVFLNITLIVSCSALIFALVESSYKKAPPEEREKISKELLCAHKTVEPDALEKAEEAVLEKGKSGTWTIRNLRPETETITLHIDYHSSSTQKLDRIDIIYKAGKGPASVTATAETYPTQPTQIELPSSVIAPDGTLEIKLTNMSVKGRSIYIPPTEGIMVSYHSISFAQNFLRIMLFGILRNSFLCAATISMCSFLTFPVALISSIIFFIAGLSGRTFLFLSQQENVFRADLIEEGAAQATPVLDILFKMFLKFLYYFSGRTSDISTAQMLSDSRMLEYNYQLISIYGLWFVYAAALLALGAWIFNKSEISRLER